MHIKKFLKTCELEKENEVIHYFENEFQETMRLVTKNKEDFKKDKLYEIVIKEHEE